MLWLTHVQTHTQVCMHTHIQSDPESDPLGVTRSWRTISLCDLFLSLVVTTWKIPRDSLSPHPLSLKHLASSPTKPFPAVFL